MTFARIAPEQHDSLPDIPGPNETPELFGHGEAAAMLASSFRQGTLPHGLILAGPKGIGKATLAFHLAYHMLDHPMPARAPIPLGRPDPQSALFRLIARQAHPAVLHLTRPARDDGKGFKSVLTVDEIRRVSRFVSLTATDADHRLVIVDPAEDMNTNAANALLKNLEEPPARLHFILITHQAGRLLPTIRSRCQMVKLAPLQPDELANALSALDCWPADPSQAAALQERAEGSVRHAILLSRYGGLEIAETVARIIGSADTGLDHFHQLANAVSGREQTIQFELFNDAVLDQVAGAARQAALRGEGRRAERLSTMWHDIKATIADTQVYNLDRKQHVLGILHRIRAHSGP